MGREKPSSSYRLAENTFVAELRRSHGRDIFTKSITELLRSMSINRGISQDAMADLLKDMRGSYLIKLKTYKDGHEQYPAGLTRIRVTQKGRKVLNIPTKAEKGE